MSLQAKQVNYPNLDLMKLLMACFVVESHTRQVLSVAVAEFVVQGIEVQSVPVLFFA